MDSISVKREDLELILETIQEFCCDGCQYQDWTLYSQPQCQDCGNPEVSKMIENYLEEAK